MKFYTDEHVSRAVIRGLRQRGLDVATVPEEDMLGASDLEHLRWANAEGRVIFTQDTDFLRLHATGQQHAGIAYAPQGTSDSRIIRGLLLIHEVLERKIWWGMWSISDALYDLCLRLFSCAK